MSDTNTENRWYTVFCKPRQERLANTHLQRQGFATFLPEAFNASRRLRKEGQRVEPLFPRYLFLQACPHATNLAPVAYTRGVSGMVRFGGRLSTVPRVVIDQIKALTDKETGLVRLDIAKLQAGDKVEVCEGPFSGIEGLVAQLCGESRAIILMQWLGREHTVSVERSALRLAI